MGYSRGTDRNAVLLFPECVEDYISDDNSVRFIDAFVESLDLVELGFERAMNQGYFLMRGLKKVGAADVLDHLELQHQTSDQHHRSQKDDRSSDMKSTRYSSLALACHIRSLKYRAPALGRHPSHRQLPQIKSTFHTV